MSTSPIPPILDQDRYAVYQPMAATTDFALGFPLFGEASDAEVFLDGAPLVLATDYTVRSATKGATLTPAPVTDAFVRLNAPISSGKLEIYGNFRPRRTIQATSPYSTRDFNFSFSLLMAALREMWSKFTRAVKVPVGEDGLTIPSAQERAGQLLAFDGDGKVMTGVRYADIFASASSAAGAAERASSSELLAASSATLSSNRANAAATSAAEAANQAAAAHSSADSAATTVMALAGALTALAGAFAVDANGHLIVTYADDVITAIAVDDDTGHLAITYGAAA